LSGDLQVVWFTLRMAFVSTAVIVVPAVAAAYLLSRYRGPGRGLLETLLSLPLVLPPTAIGLALLQLLGREGRLGSWLAAQDVEVLFTWKAVVLATGVMSFPLLVRAARGGFEAVDPRLVGIARSLGCTSPQAFLRVTLPLARHGIAAGVVLAFSRALGEFGATILVAGNIPGRTQTLALAIFQHVQAGRDERALVLAGWTVALAFAALWSAEWLSRRHQWQR
jgi:molybdate transport system permease protein